MTNVWSNHTNVEFNIGTSIGVKRNSLWVFNASLVNDAHFKKMMSNFLKRAATELKMTENVNVWWDDMKNRIKKKCIYYAKEKRWKENIRENELKIILNEETILLDKEKNRSPEKYLSTKQELENIEKKRCLGAAIRSRFQYLYEGEKCTAFFLRARKTKTGKIKDN